RRGFRRPTARTQHHEQLDPVSGHRACKVLARIADTAPRPDFGVSVGACPTPPGERRPGSPGGQGQLRARPQNLATLAAHASRLAALLVSYILPVCALLAPWHAGASTPIVATLFDGP